MCSFCSFFCWSICCVVMSPIGVIFLGVIGIMCATESQLIEIKSSIKKERAITSFIPCAIYAVIFCICVLYLIIRSKRRKKPESKDDNLTFKQRSQQSNLSMQHHQPNKRISDLSRLPEEENEQDDYDEEGGSQELDHYVAGIAISRNSINSNSSNKHNDKRDDRSKSYDDDEQQQQQKDILDNDNNQSQEKRPPTNIEDRESSTISLERKTPSH